MNPVFAVEHLEKHFGGLRVTQDVSLAMGQGDRIALIGPNGAGKTTFVNLVTGQIKPDGGRVLLGALVLAKAAKSAKPGGVEPREEPSQGDA